MRAGAGGWRRLAWRLAWAGGLWVVDARATAPCPPSPSVTAFERVAGSGVVCLAWGLEGKVGWAGQFETYIFAENWKRCRKRSPWGLPVVSSTSSREFSL